MLFHYFELGSIKRRLMKLQCSKFSSCNAIWSSLKTCITKWIKSFYNKASFTLSLISENICNNVSIFLKCLTIKKVAMFLQVVSILTVILKHLNNFNSNKHSNMPKTRHKISLGIPILRLSWRVSGYNQGYYGTNMIFVSRKNYSKN